MDREAKKRSKLLQSPHLGDRRQARTLDREIKQAFRRNRQGLLQSLHLGLDTNQPLMVNQAVKCLLTLAARVNEPQIGPDEDAYMDFLASVRPATSDTITPKPFTPLLALTGQLQTVIFSGKKGKAPGLDHIRLEMLQQDPALFL